MLGAGVRFGAESISQGEVISMQDAFTGQLYAVHNGERNWGRGPIVILVSVVLATAATAVRADDKPVEKVARRVGVGTVGEAAPADGRHVLAPAIDLAKASRDATRKANDYTATFIKRERFRRHVVDQSMEIKFRQAPLSVYCKFVDPHAGREVIFVDGQNKGQLLVHEDGLRALAGTLSFPLNHPDVMRENHYPINQFGMVAMVDAVIAQWEQEMKFSETEVAYFPSAKFGDIDCQMYQTTHPAPRSNFKFHKTCLYVEQKTKLPLRVEQFDFPLRDGQDPPLVEQYNYINVKCNVGLTDRDFDPRNKDYNF